MTAPEAGTQAADRQAGSSDLGQWLLLMWQRHIGRSVLAVHVFSCWLAAQRVNPCCCCVFILQ